MSWSVNDIYLAVQFLANKSQSGNISPTDLFYAWNIEQNMYFQDIVGRWQARANGKQGANTGLIRNETILSDLAPFTVSATIAIAGGLVAKPSDFIYTNDLRIGGVKVTHITNDQTSAVNESVIDPPSVSDTTYYYTEYEGNYSLLPASVTGSVVLDYIAAVTDVIWGFTIVDNRYIYDAGASTQPQWKQSTIVTITKRAMINLGIRFKDADFTNYGRTAQQTGN